MAWIPKTCFALGLGLCCLWVLQGCDYFSSENKPAANGTAETKTEKKLPPIVPLADGWEQPAFALVLSGEQHGYLEPCGCSETQSGGVARRHNLFKQLNEKGWNVGALDVGGTLKRARLQSQYKFDAVLQALQIMEYDALNLGPEELMLGPDQLLARHVISENEQSNSLPFVSANVTLYGSPDLGTPIRSRTFKLNGKTIGVTSIVSPALTKDVPYLNDATTMEVLDPATALKPVVEDLKAEKPDLLILLSHADLDESKKLAEQFPEIGLILSAGGPEDGMWKPVMQGDTMLIQVGQKGKHVGLVGFYPGQSPPLKFEQVDLDMRRFENSPAMTDVMRAYQKRLQEEDVVSREQPIQHASGDTFVGYKKCAECHKKAYNTWKETKHAHAFESLEKGRPGYGDEWVSRIHDPECLVCHTTGWSQKDVLRYESGYLDAANTPHLQGQQCENCHGPGSHHTELEEQYKKDRKSIAMEELLQGRREVQLTEIKAVKQVCIRCHDYDNSPNFDFEKYWPKVKHVGRD